MTRDEAIRKFVATSPTGKAWPALMVDSLVALGLLHLETTEDKTRLAAAEQITLAYTLVVGDRATEHAAKITRDGAFEIIDELLRAGFRITRDE